MSSYTFFRLQRKGLMLLPQLKSVLDLCVLWLFHSLPHIHPAYST
jgi:hypothetical protein